MILDELNDTGSGVYTFEGKLIIKTRACQAGPEPGTDSNVDPDPGPDPDPEPVNSSSSSSDEGGGGILDDLFGEEEYDD